eukprot:UN20593
MASFSVASYFTTGFQNEFDNFMQFLLIIELVVHCGASLFIASCVESQHGRSQCSITIIFDYIYVM